MKQKQGWYHKQTPSSHRRNQRRQASASLWFRSCGIVSTICVSCDIIRGVVSIAPRGGRQSVCNRANEQGESHEKRIRPWIWEIDGQIYLDRRGTTVIRIWRIHRRAGECAVRGAGCDSQITQSRLARGRRTPPPAQSPPSGGMAVPCRRYSSRRIPGFGRFVMAGYQRASGDFGRRGVVSALGRGSEESEWIRPERRADLVSIRCGRQWPDARDNL